MNGAQLPLDLGHVTALAEDDFLPAPCNAEALAWLERWPHWSGRVLAIHGPEGCGKTHLAHLFAARTGGVILPAHRLAVDMAPRLLEAAPTLALEDCDGGELDEDALFHLINLVREQRAFLLLSGRLAPARWPVVLPDLRSRLNALPVASIGAPDDAVLAAVLVKQFADRQIKVGEGVVSYLLGRMDRSFAACARLVERLDKASLAEHRAVTVALVRKVLEREVEHGSGTGGP
ncbi:DNA replication protein [Paramagnetospirillum marisnigri]|uniref:DNA replication protein n=1 Tax=Paramagnetospirillum marisnigri TaxID=1285242 RepID=A0A178MRN8_9PROT|nr:DNA replication protein [Paramagnetospirillum marisnigri]OAN50745.1 DNA replication protein [Paramagnetospirillum marisnigri]